MAVRKQKRANKTPFVAKETQNPGGFEEKLWCAPTKCLSAGKRIGDIDLPAVNLYGPGIEPAVRLAGSLHA